MDTLARMLSEAANGRFPAPDGTVVITGPPGGPAEAVVAFTAHSVVATSIAPDEVRAQLDHDDLGAALRAPFLTWVGERLERRPGSVDVVFVAVPLDGEVELDEIRSDHPRVARAIRYRTDVRVYSDGRGVLALGRGVAGRLEASFEIDAVHRGAGLGRVYADAARRIADERVWMQAAPGNAASVRAVLAAGFRPVGAECLFL